MDGRHRGQRYLVLSTPHREQANCPGHILGSRYYDFTRAKWLATIVYPNGRVVSYNYDAMGRLSDISDGVGAGAGVLESYAHLGDGTVVRRAHPQAGGVVGMGGVVCGAKRSNHV